MNAVTSISFKNLHVFSAENRFRLRKTAQLCHCISKEKRHIGEAHVQTQILDYGLAFVIVIPLVLIPEQRLVALHLVRSGAHGTCGGSKNDCDHHQGSNYCNGEDFSQSERLT